MFYILIILKTAVLACPLVSVGLWELWTYNAEDKSWTLLNFTLQGLLEDIQPFLPCAFIKNFNNK